MRTTTSTIAAAVIAALALAACGDKNEGAKPASQVAARVNSGEISVHQINYALRQTAEAGGQAAEEAKRKVLDDLVDQELALQAAVDAKLDRKPNVMQSLEAARREILARAWHEERAASMAAPTPQEIGDYYREHPELFTARRIYHLQEATFPALPDALALARDQLARGRTAGDILGLFKAKQIAVSGGTDVKAAERVDLKVLPQLAGLKDGQTTLVEYDGKATAVTVIRSVVEPMPEESARPLIDQYLRRQRVETAEKEARRELRQTAKVEYVGEFSDEAVAARRQKLAETARQLRDSQDVREAARQAQAATTAHQLENARQARETAEPMRTQAEISRVGATK